MKQRTVKLPAVSILSLALIFLQAVPGTARTTADHVTLSLIHI